MTTGTRVKAGPEGAEPPAAAQVHVAADDSARQHGWAVAKAPDGSASDPAPTGIPASTTGKKYDQNARVTWLRPRPPTEPSSAPA